MRLPEAARHTSCPQAFTSCKCVVAAAATDLCHDRGQLQFTCVLAAVSWPAISA